MIVTAAPSPRNSAASTSIGASSARAQHQIVAVPGQLARQGGADPARRTGDEGGGAIAALHG